MEKRLNRGPIMGRAIAVRRAALERNRQPDSASDARQHNERESFQPRPTAKRTNP